MPSLHEKCRYGKVFSVFVPKLRNKKKRCFALPQIAFAKGKKRKKAACKRKRLYGAGGGGRTRTPVKATDFELFASYGIQTNSNPYGGRQRTPKSPQLLIILKLMC